MLFTKTGQRVRDPLAAAKAFLDEPVALTDLLGGYDAPYTRYDRYLNFEVVRCAFRCVDVVEGLDWETSARYVANLVKDLPGWEGPFRARVFGVHGTWYRRKNDNELWDKQGRLGFQLTLPDDDEDEWEDLVGSVDDDDWRDLV